MSGHSTKTCSKQASAAALNPQSFPVSPEAPQQQYGIKDTVVHADIECLWSTKDQTLQVPRKERCDDHFEQSSGSLRSYNDED